MTECSKGASQKPPLSLDGFRGNKHFSLKKHTNKGRALTGQEVETGCYSIKVIEYLRLNYSLQQVIIRDTVSSFDRPANAGRISNFGRTNFRRTLNVRSAFVGNRFFIYTILSILELELDIEALCYSRFFNMFSEGANKRIQWLKCKIDEKGVNKKTCNIMRFSF